MLGKGADVHAASHDGGEDPRLYFSDLYGLAFYEDQEKALEAGARPAHETAKPATKPPKRIGAPRTALGWAAYNGQAAAADLLLRAGADPEAADSEGYTPLHEAALYGHIEVVRVLLSHGASVDARTEERWIPLHLAAAYGHLEIVEQLQEAGADLCATTNGGLTAMDWAKAYGYVETAEFLRTCSGEGHGRCNFFIQGGIASKVASM